MTIQRKKFGVNEFAPFQAAEILDWGYLYWPDASRTLSPSGASFTAFGTAAVTSSAHVSPTGGAFGAFGTATVYLNTRYLAPTGITNGSCGTATIYNTTTFVLPWGINNSAFGTATIYNTTTFVLPGGITPNPQTGTNSLREVPSPTIDLRTKYALPTSIAPPVTPFGTHYVALFYQFIDLAGRSILPGSFGSGTIDFKNRYVYPAFIASNIFGSTEVVRTLYVSPSGFGGGTFPTTHTIEDFSNRVQTHSGSADQAGYGIASLRNSREFLYVQNNHWVAEQFSTPSVYNRTQQVYALPYEDTNGEPAGYGVHFIENKNRVLGAFGHQDSRFSFYSADIQNKALAISPLGMDTLWGSHLVAYRNRQLPTQGFDAFLSGPYGVVYNNARVLTTSGVAPGTLGAATIFNRNRTISQYTPYEGGEFGTAFVAYRIRYVGPFPFNDIPAAFPEVRSNPHPFAPTGIDSYRTGVPDVSIHFNIIAPHSVNVPSNPTIGEPYIQNRNKEVAPYAYEQTTFGVQDIQNYIRYITPTVGDTSLFGSAQIADTRRSVFSAPFSSYSVSTFNQVRNVIPDPPGQQNIVVFGLGPSSIQIGALTMSYLTLFPLGINSGGYGTATVKTNTITYSWVFDDFVGTPSLIGTQYVYPRQIPYPALPGLGESDVFTTKPRVSPHTIYAPSADQATTQAKNNHPSAPPHIIDSDLWASYPYHFGVARIENKNRYVYPVWNELDLPVAKTLFGDGRVDLRLRYVYPTTIRSFRAGIPGTNGPQEIVDTSIGTSFACGTPLVGFPPAYVTPTIAPAGITPEPTANVDIMLKNRQVYPIGVTTDLWGTSLMGYTRRPEIQGYVATEWGVPRVEYRNRFVHPVGNEMFLSANTLYGFNYRMRVTLRNPHVLPVGLSATRWGTGMVSHKNRTIAPVGTNTASVGTSGQVV